jgi:hypothetical protein
LLDLLYVLRALKLRILGLSNQGLRLVVDLLNRRLIYTRGLVWGDSGEFFV